MEFIERFRNQLSLIDLQFKGTPSSIRKAVWSCYQEEPVQFEGQSLYDVGAFSEPPMSGKITQRVMEPWKQPQNEQEKEAVKKMQQLMDKLRNKKKDGSGYDIASIKSNRPRQACIRPSEEWSNNVFTVNMEISLIIPCLFDINYGHVKESPISR